MLTPENGSFLHTSPPLCPAWDQPCLVLGGECHLNSPRDHLYPNVTSSWQPLQEMASRQGLAIGLL